MSFNVEIKSLGPQASILTPAKPTWVEENEDPPEDFIPEHLSEEDREALREAALEFSDTLGGNVLMSAAAAKGDDSAYNANRNMRHFRHGDGEDKTYEAEEVADIMSDLDDELDKPGRQVKNEPGGIKNEFLDLVFAEMNGRDTQQKLGFETINKNNPSHPDYNTPWFGARTSGSSNWYYAIGAFQFAYGALAQHHGSNIIVTLRSFIFDRYNWNLVRWGDLPVSEIIRGGDDDLVVESHRVPIGDGRIRYPLDESEISGAEDLFITPPEIPGPLRRPMELTDDQRQRYFRAYDSDEWLSGYYLAGPNGGYELTDALFGSLTATGDATNYDITGQGAVEQYVRPRTTSQDRAVQYNVDQMGPF